MFRIKQTEPASIAPELVGVIGYKIGRDDLSVTLRVGDDTVTVPIEAVEEGPTERAQGVVDHTPDPAEQIDLTKRRR